MKKLIMLLALAIILAATALPAQQSGRADDQQAGTGVSNDRPRNDQPRDDDTIAIINPDVTPGTTSESSESAPQANN